MVEEVADALHDTMQDWGLVEFEASRQCPNGCPDPHFEIEVLQGVRYYLPQEGGWEERDRCDLAVLLAVYCLNCGCYIIDRNLEDAVAIEVKRHKQEQIELAIKRQGVEPVEKGSNRCRRRFALSPASTEGNL